MNKLSPGPQHRVDKLNSVAEAAKRLGVGRSTLYKLFDSNEIASVKVRDRRLVADSALDDYIARLTSGAA